jgi:peptidoglycan/xylan/chitin deacetylase (PgdA/CDA1 family)
MRSFRIRTTGRVYAAIKSVSGCTVIVDNSHDPMPALVLHRTPGIRPKVLHLVRDSRGVAFSLARYVLRAEATMAQTYMPRYSSAKASMEWVTANVPLGAADIDRMKAAVDFASHTRFHPVLTTCIDPDCADEIESSKAETEGLIQGPCLDFSYPNGDYGERELALVRRAGYRSGRTVDLGWNEARTDPFRLKVLGTSDVASVNRLAADLAGASGYLARLKDGSFTGRHRPVFRSTSGSGVATEKST